MSEKHPIAYGLVHGGFHGSWCWDALRPFLKAPSVAVDLPGRSADEAELAKITYEDWVAAATAQISALEVHDIVLIGHSLGGITLPQTAIRLGKRLKAIIFFAAVIPPEGKTFEEHTGYPIPGNSWAPPSYEVARMMLGTDMSDELFAGLYARLNQEPVLPLKTPVYRGTVPNVACLYIRAESDATGLGSAEVERLRHNFPQVRQVDVPGGHNIMMTDPAVLADVINDFVANLGEAND